MSAALFARLSGIPIIGVTGTRGKSTVTHMIHHVLSQATDGAPVLLGGNVRGRSNLQLLKEAEEDSIAVLELDSWQLQGFGWARLSPHIAVFTNFMEDHLNYYHGDMDAYFADKANIFLYQEDGDVLVTTPEVFERAKEFAKGKRITLGQEIVLADASVLPDDALLSTPGEHNRLNAALAYEALKATSLTDEEIFAGFASFPGVPGRLQYLREVKVVNPATEGGWAKIYNDNNATTPQATVVGLRALGDEAKKNIVLIMGGADKGIDTSELLAEIPKYCKAVVLLAGTGTGRIASSMQKAEGSKPPTAYRLPPTFGPYDSLNEALQKALAEATKEDVILFSPAFASFGMFKNEYDRNDQFVALVQEL
jgi:UDP-N-acetylmuramoylalanine--D-glutamate ligase